MKNRIAIIIPCYNGWKYMSNCMYYLEKQTVKPDQVIIVDDCSKDDSVCKIKEYIEESNLNIDLIQNDVNVGPGQSRANGLKYVDAEYVAFCDCDDWFELTFVEEIKNEIVKEDIDLIIFDNNIVVEDKKEKADEIKNLIGKSKTEILALYSMSLCRFVVRNTILKDVYFPALYNGEDAAVAPQIIVKASDIKVIDKAYYNYLYRGNSGSTTISDRVYKNMIQAFEVVKDKVSKEYYSEREFIGIKNVIYAASFNAFKAGVSNKVIREFLYEFKKEFPEWKYNSYICFLPLKKRVYLKFIGLNILGIPRMLANIHKYKYKQKVSLE